MKRLKNTFKYIIWTVSSVAGLILIYVIFVLTYAKMYEFKPLASEQLTAIQLGATKGDTLQLDEDYSLISWNIGYGGMGANNDFFYDGGSMMRPDRKYYTTCFDSILGCLKEHSADFIFLQEVDSLARRSYGQNQIKLIGEALPHYNEYFAKNYSVKYVPLPILNPTGEVNAGIVTLARFKPLSATRIDLQTNFDFPTNLFILKRCILVCRFIVANGKELIMINTHNSAFDEGGAVRKKESEIISTLAIEEYSKGNYVIIGGDWNMNPSRYNAFNISNGDNAVFDIPMNDSIYLNANWKVSFDKKIPTNRSAKHKYIYGETETTTYDFFIISPNIETSYEKTIDGKFKFSDHNMITIKFKLI